MSVHFVPKADIQSFLSGKYFCAEKNKGNTGVDGTYNTGVGVNSRLDVPPTSITV